MCGTVAGRSAHHEGTKEKAVKKQNFLFYFAADWLKTAIPAVCLIAAT